ncbi:MAG: xylose reductase [Magnetovibrio sp.]|nr:xylose reductase [Magnetovibrio sp.]|tara:strand:+ start:457 stop:1287 length:831 start_codon:yes stop_codon:yes gene_type:complete
MIIDGIKIPPFLYGTAWKEDQTAHLTGLALEQGFCGIDTANQRKHYNEIEVGHAIQRAEATNLIDRSDLFLQTKFTFRQGQDERLPYDPLAPIERQVEQSFMSSLGHLKTDFIDSYVLHGPTTRTELKSDDWAAWSAMEKLHSSGRARLLGVSNMTLKQISTLCNEAYIRPHFVQNRCYATQGWDQQIRQFCTANRMVYQGFSLLTANRNVWKHDEIAQIAKRYRKSKGQIIFRFAIDIGMVALIGTTNITHMREDLDVLDFRLKPNELKTIMRLS